MLHPVRPCFAALRRSTLPIEGKEGSAHVNIAVGPEAALRIFKAVRFVPTRRAPG